MPIDHDFTIYDLKYGKNDNLYLDFNNFDIIFQKNNQNKDLIFSLTDKKQNNIKKLHRLI